MYLINIVNPKTLAFLAGVVAAILVAYFYGSSQDNYLVLVLVVIGSFLFWSWISYIFLSLFLWIKSEIFLMGRFPKIKLKFSPLQLSYLLARGIGFIFPFAFFVGDKSWAVLIDPEIWAIVPLSVFLSVVFITLPLWFFIKSSRDKIISPSS